MLYQTFRHHLRADTKTQNVISGPGLPCTLHFYIQTVYSTSLETSQTLPAHLFSQSNVSEILGGFTFKTYLDSNPYYLGSSHHHLLTCIMREYLVLLISIAWKSHSQHLPSKLSNQSDAVKTSQVITFLLKILQWFPLHL